jgi:hypothetical protein
MNPDSYPRHSWLLWGFTLLGLAYSGVLGFTGKLTDSPLLDKLCTGEQPLFHGFETVLISLI